MAFSITKKSNLWISISALMIVLSIVSVATLGVKFGIDFTGGSITEIRFEQVPSNDALRATVAEAGYDNAEIQTSGESELLVRLPELTEDAHQALLAEVESAHGTIEEMRFDSIGPIIGNELRTKALTALVVTLVLIGLYVTWAFRKVSEPVESWKYAIITILAALHDIIIPLGVFSVAGYFFGWEVGTAFVAAMLTILGYSINDTIVVFDRTRENLLQKTGQEFSDIVDSSIRQTFMRSLNTSITTLVALFAIFLWGGETTQSFAFALIIGIITGTYSSLFLASPLLVRWEAWKR